MYTFWRYKKWNGSISTDKKWWLRHKYPNIMNTVYPKKYAHGFVVLCFVVVMQSFIMNSHEVFIHIHQSCFAGTGAIVRLPQCQWSKPDGYGKISQCITTTKHSKAKTVCIFLGIYCISILYIYRVGLWRGSQHHYMIIYRKCNWLVDWFGLTSFSTQKDQITTLNDFDASLKNVKLWL